MKIFVVTILCCLLAGCSAGVFDGIIEPLEMGASYLSLVRMSAMLLADDSEQNIDALEELSTRYDVDISSAYHDLYVSAKTFLATADKLLLAMQAEQAERSRDFCKGEDTEMLGGKHE